MRRFRWPYLSFIDNADAWNIMKYTKLNKRIGFWNFLNLTVNCLNHCKQEKAYSWSCCLIEKAATFVNSSHFGTDKLVNLIRVVAEFEQTTIFCILQSAIVNTDQTPK
jgi:hypothetical protein